MEAMTISTPTPTPTPTQMSMTTTEQHNLAVMAAVVPHWNRHNVPAILDYYDDGITWHNMAMGRVYQGKQEVGAFLTELFAGLPDLVLELTTRLPRGDSVAEEYTICGTHLGPLFGVPATGRRLRIQAVSFLWMRDGRLAEDKFYFDVASVMTQMGLLPPLSIAETAWGRRGLRVAVFARSPRAALRTARAARARARAQRRVGHDALDLESRDLESRHLESLRLPSQTAGRN